MRTQPETRARSAQEAGKRALDLRASKANPVARRCVRDRSKVILTGDKSMCVFDLSGNWARRAVLAEHGH